MSALITIENLSVTAADKVLVAPLSLSLNRGEPLTILGETGSGKSLLAQAIMGTLPAALTQRGSVSIQQQSQNSATRQQLWGKQLSMLPQEPWQALDPVMPSEQQVSEVYRYVGQANANAAQIAARAQLNQLGLSQVSQQLPQQLSGGMAQRLAFAAATAGGAQIIIADEPTKGLDTSQRDGIVELLKSQTADGGLLTITHDVAVARQLGGRIMVMRQGQLLESGTAEQVLNQPQADYTRALINAQAQFWPAAEPAPSQPKLLEVRNLAQCRGEQRLFQGLSFSLHAGEILGVYGDSGCGKSTLGDTLLGLLPPASGRIEWQQPLTRSQMLKLYQDPPASFSSAVSLGTLVNDLLKRHKLPSDAVAPLLAQLNLDADLLTRSCNDVSGGELQRIALLRAMLLSPKFLVADEPSSRLDPITAQQLTQLLVKLAREQQCALLLISHDLTQLQKVCDQIIPLKDYPA
ncbi:ABC transporter ATP-binding protein [Shewanella sp.]|uniref:ABC transporter ATP-binding protein n=1 Tax=Shewanella sp. TaxID=50422 RepID=UPI003A974AB0